jgi:MarR family 2-MHQ and catechol resistance regulon transcriptional repressor
MNAASRDEFRNEGHRALITVVQAAGRIQKEAERFLREFGVTVAQFNVLVILADQPDGVTPSAIGDRLVVSRANVTGLLGRMKRDGLCRIEPDPEDGRVKRITVTPRGRRLLGRIEGPYFAEVERVTGVLSDTRLRGVSDALDRLVDQL